MSGIGQTGREFVLQGWMPGGVFCGFMKKFVYKNGAGGKRLTPAQKAGRENVWCATFGYFIDLEACRARSYQRGPCRRCFASLLQVPLPFDKP